MRTLFSALVRDGYVRVFESADEFRVVVVEFDSFDSAVSAYQSEEFKLACAQPKETLVGDF